MPITKNLYLVYRVNELSKSIILVRRLPPSHDMLIGFEDTEQMVVATTAAGCLSVAQGLEEIAQKIRESLQKPRFESSGIRCPNCNKTELIADSERSLRFCYDCNYKEDD